MPKRIPLHTILLQRNGESVRPKIGVPFDFTAEELETLTKLNPSALGKIPTAKDPVDDGRVSMTLEELQAKLDEAAKPAEGSLVMTQEELDAKIAEAVAAAQAPADTKKGAKAATKSTDEDI